MQDFVTIDEAAEGEADHLSEQLRYWEMMLQHLGWLQRSEQLVMLQAPGKAMHTPQQQRRLRAGTQDVGVWPSPAADPFCALVQPAHRTGQGLLSASNATFGFALLPSVAKRL